MRAYFPPQRIVRGVLAGLTAMVVCILTLLVTQLPVLFWIVLSTSRPGYPLTRSGASSRKISRASRAFSGAFIGASSSSGVLDCHSH